MRLRNILILAVILAVLAGAFYWVRQPKPTAPANATVYVWQVEMDEITHIDIQLPREGPDVKQSFIKIPQGDQFPWFFDDAQHSPVDTARWGGGIPLLLSGPGAARVLPNLATAEQLTEYGLTQPSMKITVTLANNNVIESDVGDITPDGQNCYVRAPGSNQVALVDITWYQVLERLVKEPPYATGS